MLPFTITPLLALSLLSWTARAASTVVLPVACVSACSPIESVYNAYESGENTTVALSPLCSEPLYDEFVSCVNCVTANGSPTFLGYAPAEAVSDVDSICLAQGTTVSGTVTATQTASGPFTTVTESGNGTVAAGSTTATGSTKTKSTTVSATSGASAASAATASSQASTASTSAAAASSSTSAKSAASPRIAVGGVAGLGGVVVAALSVALM
ncbi:hypothetical protein JCM24511_03378 [Saitozyma sp. JCM 24511]|nr:hypothetical protein JCM24511_03378 [Saitozyma sp. JCM 24511]